MYSDSITPPPTPPRVAFDPPLFLQRRTAIIDILHNIHKLPRFKGQLKSLLDVGCGVDCMLLGSLISLNDDLPVEHVTGIDLDDGLLDQTLVNSLGPTGQHVGDEGRWRKFGLTLLHGNFERLSLRLIKHHDIVVSTEVIEHLDPEPLSNFAQILLGQLKPRVCIITTPNRDFNELFSLPFTPEITSPPEVVDEASNIALGEEVDPNNVPPGRVPTPCITTAHEEAWRALSPGDVMSSDNRYWRAGIPYGMRHPDHRFEWSRQEFRNWAYKTAEDFGYDVAFTGVGGLGNGMCVYGSTGWAVGDALARGCGYSTEGDEAPESRDEGVLTKANEVWGDCTQMAIFTIREDEEKDAEDFVKAMDWSKQHPAGPSSTSTSSMNPFYFPNHITEIAHHDFPYDADEVFPPTYLTVMELIEQELSNYLPDRIREQWTKTTAEVLEQKLKRNHNPDLDEFLFESDSECDYGWNPEVDGDEVARQVRKKERRYEKKIRRMVEKSFLAGKDAEMIKVVKITGVSLKDLWEGSVGGKNGLRRLCRFRQEVFKEILMNGWKAHLEPGTIGEKAEGGWFCKPIIDTTGVYKEPEGENKLVVAQNFGEPVRRRQMSISRADPGISHPRTGQQLTSPCASPIKQRHPDLPSGSTSGAKQTAPSLVLSSHVFTSLDYPLSPLSNTIVAGEDTFTMEPIDRRRSLSMPSSPNRNLVALALDSTQDSPSSVPLGRTQSDSAMPIMSVQPKKLPVQLESDTSMVVKIYSTSAVRSVIDLIRRDLTKQDKETLRLWRVIKVEFNVQESQLLMDEDAARSPSVTDSETDSEVDWGEVGSVEVGEEDWVDALPPAPFEEGQRRESMSWGDWGTDPGPVGHCIAPEDNIFDNVSVISDQTLPYSIDEYGLDPDAEPSPWSPITKTTEPHIKYHTELIYPLENVNTILSIDKGKPREHECLQADLRGFLCAYKQLEMNDQSFLNIDWRDYTKAKERVARWMEERRLEVYDYTNTVATMLAAGFARERIPGRKALVAWEEWLAKVESEETEGMWGGASDRRDDIEVGVVVFRPRGRGGVEERFVGEKKDPEDVVRRGEKLAGLEPGEIIGGGLHYEPYKTWDGIHK